MVRKPKGIECEEVHLEGILAEFRTALRQEIEASSRHASSSAVPLANGRRIAQVGGSYQYVFHIQNALNLPGDTPGDLIVPEHAPIQITVISVEGLTVTLSAPEDLGSFVPSASLQSNLTYLMRKLIERIEEMADKPNPAGNRILRIDPPSGSPAAVEHLRREPDAPNRGQLEAVASSLGRDTTFIWGPPGTGKTRTIGDIGEQLYKSGRSVLIVSHTNVAVDHAIIEVGNALGRDEWVNGKVLRVGEPRDPRLNVEQHELSLKTHVDRRSKALAHRRDSLTEERKAAATDVLELSRRIDICKWLPESEQDIRKMTEDLISLRNLETELGRLQEHQSALSSKCPYWSSARRAAERASDSTDEIRRLEKQASALKSHQSQLDVKLKKANEDLAEGKATLGRAEEIAPLRERLRKLPSLEKQTHDVSLRRAEAAKTGEILNKISNRLKEAQSVYEEALSVGRFVRLWRRLPSPERQKEIVESIERERQAASERDNVAMRWLKERESLLNTISSLEEQLRPHRDVPDLDSQKSMVGDLESKVGICQAECDETKHLLAEALEARARHLANVKEFEEKYSASADEVIRQAAAHAAALAEISQKGDKLRRELSQRSLSLQELLRQRVLAVQQMGLISEEPTTMEAMLSGLNSAHERAAREVEGLALESLCSERDRLNERIRFLEAEIQGIEEALKKVEELLVKEAMVIATTLTRSYLRETIRARRFDTVILDEASMAPIPALWVAASLADKNAVVVGDYKQLAPIVISNHELAKEWLGKDIFEKARLRELSNRPPYFVPLQVQYRMHPDISAIPNALVYCQGLEDGPNTRDDSELDRWYRFDWGHDSAVLLVDTGSANAWVTSVPRAPGSSRLNFLSATMCVDLAQQLLREDRANTTERDDPRILIACPYRPHAQLLDLLLREHDLQPEVSAGTVHSFQGREAGVVIFDLVNDEPHWRVGMFMQQQDENMRRLLNVALTRARRRLVVLGDFDYIAKLAKKAFVGRRLIPFLRSRYPCVDALDIMGADLAARAAKAQASVFGGDVEPDSARLVVSQERFYQILLRDLARAQQQIIIYSPFVTRTRITNLRPQLRAAIERDVMVYVITKPHSDRGKRKVREYRILEQTLTDWGVVVIHKRRMHEKLVFIDDRIVWVGSLNPLSFSDTQEIMERRESKKVVADYVRTLRLQHLVEEYEDGTPMCPVCELELVASEGKDKPFYWRCVNEDCEYTRDIDQPPITDGIIRCFNCAGGVEYGTWGRRPAWRCLENRHHHQRVAAAHLRLPKMRAIIPDAELRELDKRYDIRTYKGHPKAPGVQGQLELQAE